MAPGSPSGRAARPLGSAVRRYTPDALDRQRYALYSVLAVVVTLIFLFPLFWEPSTTWDGQSRVY
ncbi:MAG: hypothetical protein ACREJ0_29725 [Geminicoccaceae bacterium]